MKRGRKLRGLRRRAQAGVFEGTQGGRLFNDWIVAPLSPDREVRYALKPLRARARDLVKNNGYAAGIVDAWADNIVGPVGIQLMPANKGPDGTLLIDLNRSIAEAWMDWGQPETASLDGNDSFTSLERQMVRTFVTDGEVFVRMWPGWSNPYAFALQLVDADLLDEGYNVPPDAAGVEIRMGIEMDRYGRRLAYHFYRDHPADIVHGMRDRVRVPASEVLHLFPRLRPGQSRGYSLFAPVLTTFKMIDGYSEAELVASRMAAAKMGFITNNEEDAVAAYVERLRAQTDEDGEQQEDIYQPGRAMDVAPGLIEELIPGQGFEGFDPTHPNTAFGDFLMAQFLAVARGFGISHQTATGDVSSANYSSMRAGLLPERRHWAAMQREFFTQAHRPIYRDNWLPLATLTGQVALPTPMSSDWDAHKWLPPGWDWVDPLKDKKALEVGVALGVDSRTRAAAARGQVWVDVVDELAMEQAYAAEKGVDISGATKTKTQTQTVTAPAGAAPPPAAKNGNGSDPLNRLTGATSG